MRLKFLGIILIVSALFFVACPQPETPEAPTFPAIEILPVTIGDVSFVNFKGEPLTSSTSPTLSFVQGKVNAIDSSVSYLSGGWNSNVFSLTSSNTIDGHNWNDFKKQIQKNSSAEIVYSVDDFFPDNVVVSVISQVSAGNIKFVNIDGELLEGYLLEDTITKINALASSEDETLIEKMFTDAWDVTTADITLSDSDTEPSLGDWTKLKEGVNALSTEDVRVRFNDKDTENVEIEVTDEIKIGKISLVNLAGEPLVDTAAIEIVTAKITDPLNTNFAGLFALPWDITFSDYIPQESMVSINAWNTFVENIKAMNDASILEVRIDDSDKENVIVTVNNGYVVDSFTLIGFDGNELSADTVPSVADIVELLNNETSLASMFGAVWNEDSAIYQPVKDTSYVTVTDLATLVAEINKLNTDFLAVAVSEEVLETGAKAYTIKVEKPYGRITFIGENNSPLSESVLTTTKGIVRGIVQGTWRGNVFVSSADISNWQNVKDRLTSGLTANSLNGSIDETNRADIYVTVKDTLEILGFTLVNSSGLEDSTARNMFTSDLTGGAGDVYGGSWSGNKFSFTNTDVTIAESENFVATLSENLSSHTRTDAIVEVDGGNKENIIVTVHDPQLYVTDRGNNTNSGYSFNSAFATPQRAVDKATELFETQPNVEYVIRVDGDFTASSSTLIHGQWGPTMIYIDVPDTEAKRLNITMQAYNSYDRPLFNGKNLGAVLYIVEKVDFSLQNIDITGGQTNAIRINGSNGAALKSGTSFIAKNSVIYGNSGASVVAIDTDVVALEGVTIQNNKNGTGFHLYRSNGRVTNTTITNNGGDGITIINSWITVNDNSEISHNDGTGVSLESESSLTFNAGAKISDNSENGIHAVEDSTVIVKGGIITRNGGTSSNGVTNGGGIYSSDSRVDISGYATISNNYAKKYGGGIYSTGGSVSINGTYVKITENEAGTRGGGIYGTSPYSSAGNRLELDLLKGKIYENKATSGGGVAYDQSHTTYTKNDACSVTNNTVGNILPF